MKSKTIDDCKILLGTFILHLLLAGSARLAPILFVESLTHFDVDRSQASFPFVLSFMIRNLSGPLVGYMEQIVGMQLVILTGCVIAPLSICACFYAQSIVAVNILWGVLFGISFGLACQMLPIILNKQFPKSRNKANSLYFAGSSLGGLLLPVIFKWCIGLYGISGSFLILGSIVAHCIPAGLLLKYSKKDRQSRNVSNNNNNNGINKTADDKTIHPSEVFVINLKQNSKIFTDDND